MSEQYTQPGSLQSFEVRVRLDVDGDHADSARQLTVSSGHALGEIAVGGQVEIDMSLGPYVESVAPLTPEDREQAFHTSRFEERMNKYELRPREREIANLIADGLTNAEIGTALSLSAATIRGYVLTLFEKVDCTSRAGMIGVLYLGRQPRGRL